MGSIMGADLDRLYDGASALDRARAELAGISHLLLRLSADETLGANGNLESVRQMLRDDRGILAEVEQRLSVASDEIRRTADEQRAVSW